MAPAPLSAAFQSLPLLPTIKLGPSGAGSRVGGLVHALGPPWVSPTTSPVRLGVSPAAASIPMGVFTQRFEALFPHAGALGYAVCFAPPPFVQVYLCANWGPGMLPAALPAPFSATLSPALSVYLSGNVGPLGLLVVRLPALFVPHSASLGPATAMRVLSAPPTGLDEYFFFISLVSDFLAIRFSVSSGCVKRHSVSTYATILVLSQLILLNIQ